MKIIGITGGIGTGKSTVLDILSKEYDAYVVETDKLAHRIMRPGTKTYEEIVKAFGETILQDDGTIDRGILGGIVFEKEASRRMLNGIVHPAVKEYIINDIHEKTLAGKTSLYVIEAALLIEDGYREICDELWYIYSEKEVRLKRLLLGRGGTEQKWQNIMANQSNETFYKSNCDRIIDNGKSIEETRSQLNELLCLQA